MTTDKQEYTLLDTDLSTRLSILPVMSGRLYLELNEPGSGEVKISQDTTAASLVASGQFVQASYRGSVRDGFFVENIKNAYANDEENGGKTVSMSGRGALAMLEDAIVWDDGTGSTRTFTAKTKGYIVRTLIDEAQARGGLQNITYTFDSTDDSASVAWTDTLDVSFPVGTSLLDVVRQFVQTGVDFWLNSATMELNAYKNGKGTDKSGTIYFRVGTNCEEVESDERGNDIKNALLVAYKTGFTTSTDPTSIAARRRREELLDIKNAQTLSSATTYGSAKVALTKDPKKSQSRSRFMTG